jgi:hypothetical protein
MQCFSCPSVHPSGLGAPYYPPIIPHAPSLPILSPNDKLCGHVSMHWTSERALMFTD